MLPYPSGALHMGHVRNYAIGDALARYMWMNGYNVLHPMGWDSFGLPAENAAIQNNTPPREWTLRNIANMKAQMKRLGFAYDWSREVTTCLPDYYRWNQWFFLKFYERGLAYRKKSKVNWCPNARPCSRTSRSSADAAGATKTLSVEQRELEQWFLRITKYADELLRDLDRLAAGRKKSAPCSATGLAAAKARWSISIWTTQSMRPCGSTITVFTTRVDTIFGATSVQLAPQHPIMPILRRDNRRSARARSISSIAEQRKAKEVGDIGDIEKHGVYTGRFAMNPFNGEKVPVWVANYILMDYGTGAIMSVPAHDERDYEFAKKYKTRNSPRDLADHERSRKKPWPSRALPFTTHDGMLINSGQFSGLSAKKQSRRCPRFAEEKGFGKATVTYPPERLGHLAPALLGHADPHGLLRERWHRPRAGKRFAGYFAR